MHGYQLIQEIARAQRRGLDAPAQARSTRRSPCSRTRDSSARRSRRTTRAARRSSSSTDAGRAYVTEHADELADPWDAVTGGVSDSMAELMGLIREVHGAAVQVLRTGDAARVEQARTVLAQTRRSLYLVLAGEDPAGPDSLTAEAQRSSTARATAKAP